MTHQRYLKLVARRLGDLWIKGKKKEYGELLKEVGEALIKDSIRYIPVEKVKTEPVKFID